MSVARVAGRGAVDVTPGGLVVEGRILGAESAIPWWASLGVLAVGLLVARLVPNAERVLTPATVLVVGGILWFRYRAEFGMAGAFTVPWSDVEHVVRMPSAPGVVAVVLSRPLAGPGTPEQIFFGPTEGPETFLAALRAAAPAHLTWDTESAGRALAAPTPSDDAPGDEE
jgi:hypothetical protein